MKTFLIKYNPPKSSYSSFLININEKNIKKEEFIELLNKMTKDISYIDSIYEINPIIFENNFNPLCEAIQNNNYINIPLSLYDNQYEELVKRSNFTKKTGITFDNVMNSDNYFNAYININQDKSDIVLYLEFDYIEYYVPLLEKEKNEWLKDLDIYIKLSPTINSFEDFFDEELIDEYDYEEEYE